MKPYGGDSGGVDTLKSLGPSDGYYFKAWELCHGLVFTYDIHEWGLGIGIRWWSVESIFHNVCVNLSILCFRLEFFHFRKTR